MSKTDLFQFLSDGNKAKVVTAGFEQDVWDEYGCTQAVLAMDSSGFSRISESHGIVHFLSRIIAMRAIVKPILLEHGAVFTLFDADNAFAAFDHPDQAIRASLAIHQALTDHGLMLTDAEPFTLCSGIGYGRMLDSRTWEGFYGDEMNLASKLGEDTAKSRETLITENAYNNASPELTIDAVQETLQVAGITAVYYRLLPLNYD